jgi:hypothetical protein
VALLLGCVTGCSEERKEPSAPVGASFDLFLNDQLAFINYAQQKVRNNCLTKAGYPETQALIVPKDLVPFESLKVKPSMFGFASEEEARTQGLGRDASFQPGKVVNSDSNFESNLLRCDKEAWTALGDEAKSTLQAYYDLGNALLSYRREVSQALPGDLQSRFLDCMERSNYPVQDREAYLKAPNHQAFGVPLGKLEDLPRAGSQTPSGAGLKVSPATPARRYLPTRQESELAVVIYRCQQEINLVRLSMEAAERIQKRLVEQHETTFLELNPKIEKIARDAAALVGER